MSTNGWIGNGIVIGAHAPSHMAVPMTIARSFTPRIVSSAALTGKLK
jgi:hypothetical protein